jgi:ESF2/ABP1 family protein
MSAYGSVGRVFLQPKNSREQIPQKKKANHIKKHQEHIYSEGWVEFEEKKVAKAVETMLNGNTMGECPLTASDSNWSGLPLGGRHSFSQDVWSVKYLTGFKWSHLTDQVAHERAAAADRLRFHVQSSRAQQNHYLEQVEKARIQKFRIQKKKAQDGSEDEGGEAKESSTGKASEPVSVTKRQKQKREYEPDDTRPASKKPRMAEEVEQVLSLI